MTEDIRFTFGANENWEDILIDHLEGKGYLFYEIDVLCNELWEQIKQFEKFNQELSEENEKLKEELSEKDIELDYLQSENKHMRDLVNENKKLKFELKECKERKLFSRRQLEKENKELKQELKDCTAKAKEEIRKQKEENAIRWANIGR